jgi:hypothetical protein
MESSVNSNFTYRQITANGPNWSNSSAVSGHYNGGKAYEYFKNVFGRNSINGSGGNIISFINVRENGAPMDNAFWNGQFIFYGNGSVAFDPLAGALDVAGHEMSHGVIQATANLEYRNESGAINESFADVFGAMIDRDDWTIGEEIARTNIFPSGALRDLADPHNGGSQLGDNGWQPSHVNEQFHGSEDNGGVHINSGIPNHAFFLLATAIGKQKAEQIYYRTLTRYLTRSSDFKDLRAGVLQSAEDLFGVDEVDAAMTAFAAVGIGSGGGGGGQTDIDENQGDDLVLMTDADNNDVYLSTGEGVLLNNGNPITNEVVRSPLSVTDDGSVAVFVNGNDEIFAILFDWANGTIDQQGVLQLPEQGTWRKTAISKDGRLLAAVKRTEENIIHIFDFSDGSRKSFELYNPTTGQGLATDDVRYADAMEFDYTGEWVMYDAFNRIEDTGGSNSIEYWDVGFLNVWSQDQGSYADGFISKLFSSLPAGTSVGNPVFSKNSPYIIAFDLIENDIFGENLELWTANIETGEAGGIFQNSVISYPSFSRTDDRLIFDFEDNFGQQSVSGIMLDESKLQAVGNRFGLVGGARWGIWFSNAQRELPTNIIEAPDGFEIDISPNPASDFINISSNIGTSGVGIIYDMMGRVVLTVNLTEGSNTINTAQLEPGNYYLQTSIGQYRQSSKIIIQ